MPACQGAQSESKGKGEGEGEGEGGLHKGIRKGQGKLHGGKRKGKGAPCGGTHQGDTPHLTKQQSVFPFSVFCSNKDHPSHHPTCLVRKDILHLAQLLIQRGGSAQEGCARVAVEHVQVPCEQGALHDLHQLQGDVQGDGDELVDEDHEAQELHQNGAAPGGQVGKHPADRAAVAVAGKGVAVGRVARGKGQ